jgi:hypothetical protein
MAVTAGYVQENTNKFFSLFPHRFDYLVSTHPIPGESPGWTTENRHPLSDRLLLSGDYLYGVRFGKTTRYALLDIDATSVYHPARDPFAVQRMMAALEDLGFSAYLAVTSSYSNGIHIYLPFEESLTTWRVGSAITSCLEAAGFKVEAGCLEIFPNARGYDPASNTLFNGHRLPLQAGSYLLNAGFGLTNGNRDTFRQQWEFCSSKNDVQEKTLKQVIRRSRRKHERLSHRSSKFLNDLNCCIDLGWTGHGQTNFILGRIALRSYIFGHIINRVKPLEGDQLVADIVYTAMQLPGYRDYCRHQHEIWSRAEDWARSVERSRYWHCNTPRPPISPEPVEADTNTPRENHWNQWQQQQARKKLSAAIADLLNRGTLPCLARDRFLTLTRVYNLGGPTLYKHRDLWHPDHLLNSPPDPPSNFESSSHLSAEGAGGLHTAPSLFAQLGCNASDREGYRQFLREIFDQAGCNTPFSESYSDLNPSPERLEDDTGQD